jgi:hydroxyacylglutathione hydrolase
MLQVSGLPAFQDNYIWCLHNQSHCAVVDPGDDSPVLAFLADNKLTLTDILVTHHHYDHVDGIANLLAQFPNARVWGSASSKVTHISHKMQQGESVSLPELETELLVMNVPGHTLDHVAYYGTVGLFCGDTLFSAGCGRLFEGTPLQMHQSLSQLSALPAATKVYCTHEYTLANVAFALAVDPTNSALLNYKQWADEKRANNQPTLPTSIAEQLSINPFLRVGDVQVIRNVQSYATITSDKPEDIFTELRRWKDVY